MLKASENTVGSIYCKINDNFYTKSDGTLVVYGWASQDNIDSANEIVPVSAIDKAIEAYAEFANIREMHNFKLGGAGVCDVMMTERTGLWIQATIVSPSVIEKIRKKVYKGFSIGYRILNAYRRADGVLLLVEIELTEISVVDRPMNKKCLLEHIDKNSKEKIQGGIMAKVLTEEQRNNLPDTAFAFVGDVNGKSERLFPYKDAEGVADEELAIASLNIINSNRPEDVKSMTEEQRKASFDTILKSIDGVNEKADIPAFVPINEFGNKADNGFGITVNSVKLSKEEVKSMIAESVKGGETGIIDKIKTWFSGKRDNHETGEKADETTVAALMTTISNEQEKQRIILELYDIYWILNQVLWNILYSADLTADERELATTRAFNDTKNLWQDLCRQLEALNGKMKQTEEQGKTIQNNKGGTVENIPETIEQNGKTYVLKKEANTPVTTENQGKGKGDDNPQNKGLTAEDIKGAIEEALKPLSERLDSVAGDVDKIKEKSMPSQTRMDQGNDGKKAFIADRDDPNFWSNQNGKR